MFDAVTEQTRWREIDPRGTAEILNPEPDREDFFFLSVEAKAAGPAVVPLPPSAEWIQFFLTIDGRSLARIGRRSTPILPGTVAVLEVPAEAGEKREVFRNVGAHRFLQVAFRTAYLKGILAPAGENLLPGLASILEGGKLRREAPLGITEPMAVADATFVKLLKQGPVTSAASFLWFRAKATEFAANHCFPAKGGAAAGEFFCTRQNRAVQERILKAKRFLAQTLDEPLDLAAVARAAGCSAHYLSRLFSQETGLTLKLYLRGLRVQKAAELIGSGKANVSEAAVLVGYQSFSHFARAFQAELGVTPSRYAAR